MNKHTTVDLDINGELVPIDCGMVGALRWLNDLPGVATRACCEGDRSKNIRPYCSFTCSDQASLGDILRSLRHPDFFISLGIITVSEFRGQVSYRLGWAGGGALAIWEGHLDSFRDYPGNRASAAAGPDGEVNR